MPFWQRLLITVISMPVASFVANLIWQAISNTDLPSYISGLVGGLVALPVWELLKRIKIEPKPK